MTAEAATPWWSRSAADLGRAFRAGEVTPTRVLTDCLARIDALNPRLNAFVALRREAAMADAERSTERFAQGRPLGALDGVPLAVKDNLPTADLPTAWGSVAGRAHQPAHDETVVARARAAGLVLVGKTNVPEFTLEGYTHNRLFGTTGNPWDPRLTPGGSSGGSVAAVAAGMVPLALGTDGGGSTRRPAGYTGLVGLKPSIGAIAREHALPPLLLDFEVVGLIARDAADLRLLFDTVAGPLAGDLASWAALGAARRLPSRLKVLYVPTLDGAPVDPDIAAHCAQAVRRLADRGHELRTGPLPLSLKALNEAWPQIGQVGLAGLFQQQPSWCDGAGDRYREMAEAGAQWPATAMWQLQEQVAQLRRDAARMFEQVDLVVTPASAAMPWPADQPWPPTIAGEPVGPRGHAVFTGWVNAAGLPAVALPAAPGPGGLPIGLQCIGPYGSDAALLALAADLEGQSGPSWRFPDLS